MKYSTEHCFYYIIIPITHIFPVSSFLQPYTSPNPPRPIIRWMLKSWRVICWGTRISMYFHWQNLMYWSLQGGMEGEREREVTFKILYLSISDSWLYYVKWVYESRSSSYHATRLAVLRQLHWVSIRSSSYHGCIETTKLYVQLSLGLLHTTTKYARVITLHTLSERRGTKPTPEWRGIKAKPLKCYPTRGVSTKTLPLTGFLEVNSIHNTQISGDLKC